MEAATVHRPVASLPSCYNCINASFGTYGLTCVEWNLHVDDDTVAEECEEFTPTKVRENEMEKVMGRSGSDFTRAVDTVPIDSNQGRISGRFDIDDNDAAGLLYDNEVMIVMMARVSAPTFSETKNGEITRVSVLKPHEVRLVRDEKAQKELLESLEFDQTIEASLFDADLQVTPEASPITFDVEDEFVLDDESDVTFEDGVVEGEPEPEPEFTGTSDDDEDQPEWTAEDEEAALAEFYRDSSKPRDTGSNDSDKPTKAEMDARMHRRVQREIRSGGWN